MYLSKFLLLKKAWGILVNCWVIFVKLMTWGKAWCVFTYEVLQNVLGLLALLSITKQNKSASPLDLFHALETLYIYMPLLQVFPLEFLFWGTIKICSEFTPKKKICSDLLSSYLVSCTVSYWTLRFYHGIRKCWSKHQWKLILYMLRQYTSTYFLIITIIILLHYWQFEQLTSIVDKAFKL